MKNMNPYIIRFIRFLWSLKRKKDISTYFDSSGVRKLQLGSGFSKLDGWLNTDYLPYYSDYVYLDVRKPFPLDDNCFDYIFSEHMIEHINYNHGIHMLQECYRVLRPGGILRVVTPDLAVLLNLYFIRNDEGKEYITWIKNKFITNLSSNYGNVFVINNLFYNWGHRFLYDRYVLEEAMEVAGFRYTKVCDYCKSDYPELTNIESHGKSIGSDKIAAYESLIIEATK